MTSNETATADNKVAPVLSPRQLWTDLVDVVQAMVSSFVQIVAVQSPYLNSFLLNCSVGVLGPAVGIEFEPEW